MSKLGFLKNIALVIALVVVVFFAANYGGSLKNQVLATFNIPGSSVKGASTERAQEISEKFKSDLGSEFDIITEQVLNLKISDAIDGISRLQKIPRDFQSVKEYTQEQISHFSKKKK